MSTLKVRALCAAVLFGAAGCGALSMAEEAPATLVNSTESRAVLQRAVSSALKRESVLLADDALVNDSILTLEPARLRDPQGNLIQGRELRAPERFRLVKDGQACILIHEGSGARTTLAGVQCVGSPMLGK